MKSHLTRVILEKSIIAELISDPNAYIKVAGILSPKNFSVFKYEQIYRACQEIYPNAVCLISLINNDRVSIDDLLKIEAPLDGKLGNNISRSALILVECSIIDQFNKVINKLLEENTNDTKRSSLLDIKYNNENQSDIFRYIDLTINFFTEHNYIEELKALEDFQKNVVDKCKKIKSNVHVQELYFNLENLYHFDESKKHLLQALSKVTRYVMANEIPSTISNQIINISISL